MKVRVATGIAMILSTMITPASFVAPCSLGWLYANTTAAEGVCSVPNSEAMWQTLVGGLEHFLFSHLLGC